MKKIFRSKYFFAMMGLFASTAMNAQIQVGATDFIDKEDGKWTKLVVESYAGPSTIGYFDEENESMTYEIKIPSTGFYTFSAKYVAQRDGAIRVITDDGAFADYQLEGNVKMGKDWYSLAIDKWYDIPETAGPSFYLTEGTHTFKVVNKIASANIENFSFTKSDVTDKEVVKIKHTPSKIELMPKDQLEVSPIGYNAAGQKIALPVKFSSNVKDGIYTAGDYGKDKITVTMGGYSQELSVNITKPTKRKEFVVTKNGFLNTKKGYVANEKGEKLSLAGISYFWMNEEPVGHFWCKETVDYLVDAYNIQVLRLPITISPCGANGQAECTPQNDVWGYKEGDSRANYRYSPKWTKEIADEVIKACIENDIYVIIDFHEHRAHDWTDLAKDFFTYFAGKWGEFPNVMYEIYNEPLYDNGPVITYANQIIPHIRKIDSKNVIIVGSKDFSRDPDGVKEVANGQENIAFTWHGYVKFTHQTDWASHSNWNNGLPVVVTEWGCTENGGDGELRSIYKDRGVIHCFWSIANKQDGDDAAWSILKSNRTARSGWTESGDLSYTGKMQLDVAKSWINYTPKVLVEETPEFTTSICAGSKLFLPEDKVSVYGAAEGGSGNYTYKWEQTKGEGAKIASPSSAKTDISNLQAGVNVFTLTISDGTDSETMSVTITVYPEGWVDPGTIDDVADNDLISRIGGKWSPFDDSKDAGKTNSVPTVSAANGSIKVTCKMGNACSGNVPAYCGVNLYLAQDSTQSLDITNCSKITYKFKGSEHFFRAALSNIKDGNYHCALIEGSNEWKEVSLSVSSLQQEDWGTKVSWDATDVNRFSWMAKGGENTTKTLEIDDVTCVGMEFPENMDGTAVENATEISKMFLYPNPAEDGHCTMVVLERTNVVITNVAGQIVKEFVAVPDFNNEFSINEKGIYFVKAGNEVVKLIVK